MATTTAVRIDNLEPGTYVELDLNGSIEQAQFLGIEGEGDDRRARFESILGNQLTEWEAYRYNGHWAWGSSADRLHLDRVLPPTAADKPKRKTVTVPAFTVGHLVPAQFPETTVELEPMTDAQGVVLKGNFIVHVTPTYPCATPVRIGSISKFGTGWTAQLNYGEGISGKTATFTGDYFPTRTGKHTQTYALAFLIATLAGVSQTDATYSLKYEGVSA